MKQEKEDLTLSFAPQNLGGPKGLGEPDDKSLRKVEKEVLIPKVMRDRAKVEKCVDEVAAFESCCKTSSVLMVVKCREENEKLRNCLAGWYKNDAYIKECTEIYLNERSEYRRTGLQKKYRQYLKERDLKAKQVADARASANIQ